MKRGDIYLVSLDPTAGHEQRGNRPVLVVSPTEFNETTGIVRCDQPRVIDLAARHARKVDTLPAFIMDEVLARVSTLFE